MRDCLEYLQSRLLLETTQPAFSEMPFRFAEIAKVLLDVYVLPSVFCPSNAYSRYDSASEDFQEPERIRHLLKDIREARQAKSREGLSKLDHSELSVRHRHSRIPYLADAFTQLPNLSSMEINEIRPFFVHSMGVLTRLVKDPEGRQMDQQ